MIEDPAGIGPFFESFGEIHTRLVKASAECADPAMADLFRSLAAQMQRTGAELRTVATKSVEESQKLFQETREATEIALAKGRETVDQLRSVVEKNREFLKNAAKESAKHPAPSAPAAPKLKVPQKKVAPLELSPGDDLRDLLVPPPVAGEPSVPRTHGNIWDNWRIAARQDTGPQEKPEPPAKDDWEEAE